MPESSEFSSGLRSGIVPALSAAPFGMLFGAVSVTQGQSVFETAVMSLTIFAGASQLVGVELFGQRVAPWLIIASIVAVNFRHVLYSAALTPVIAHFSLPKKLVAFFLMTDPQFAEALKRHEEQERVTFSWYLGAGLVLYVLWNIMTLIGATLGGFIKNPEALGLDILLPIYFLSLVMGFRKRPNYLPIVAASALGSILAYATVGSPWHVSIGALAGILLAALLPPGKAREAAR
ncbi:AzlC family ABC transporter permease [Martelella sp. AD-3]|uniref:AzlC family ABC transporter permease n=1 Tax=Martelella sp. AD-3 TaxID=686597 RepID=UPI000463B30C|nr:AzlC family ABC transporter permease [Martelella sp. AD-3]